MTVATKVSQETADILNRIAKAKGIEIYELMQLVVQFIVRSTKSDHNLSDEMNRLLVMWHSDPGWKDAYNHCHPTAKKVIDQEVLIMHQEGRKGFGATMINRPIMGKCTQTECVDDIVERVVEVCMPGIYRRLRMLSVDMGCDSISDLLILLTDSATIQALEDSDRKEMEAAADYVESGKSKPLRPWSQRYKRKHRRDPDSLANDHRVQTIRFEPEDVPDLPELSEPEDVPDLPELPKDGPPVGGHTAGDWLTEHMDFRPHGEDW